MVPSPVRTLAVYLGTNSKAVPLEFNKGDAADNLRAVAPIEPADSIEFVIPVVLVVLGKDPVPLLVPLTGLNAVER